MVSSAVEGVNAMVLAGASRSAQKFHHVDAWLWWLTSAQFKLVVGSFARGSGAGSSIALIVDVVMCTCMIIVCMQTPLVCDIIVDSNFRCQVLPLLDNESWLSKVVRPKE